ncbi:PaaI family thioesterase [Aspergillus undulatus]|uniref:PaaI family thioesterase n=1 Tax=Aspergillus undulatus TaxID=1810928 RepID=UPI003CCCD701
MIQTQLFFLKCPTSRLQLRLLLRNHHYSLQFKIPGTNATKRLSYYQQRQHLIRRARFSSSMASSTPTPHTQQPTRHQDQNHDHGPNHAKQIETLISSLPLTRYLRTAGSGYTEFRPLQEMHPSAQETHLVTTSFLSNGSKMPVEPIFSLKSPVPTQEQYNGREQVQYPSIIGITYLFTHLTGHAGFIHGGLLTVLFDDLFARLASEILPSRIGMTARLEMDFRTPVTPGRVAVYRGVVERVAGRKVYVKGEFCLGLGSSGRGVVGRGR